MNWAALWRWVYEKLIDEMAKPSAPGAVSGHVWLGSGDDEMATREARVDKLRQILEEAVWNPDWVAAGGKTFCNKAAQFEAERMGYTFQNSENETIDDMIDEMSMLQGHRWKEDTIARGHAHAMKGGLALICIYEHPHGHVAGISPEPMQASGSWGEEVPMVANVGEPPNGIKKLSQAFFQHQRAGLRCFLLDVEEIA